MPLVRRVAAIVAILVPFGALGAPTPALARPHSPSLAITAAVESSVRAPAGVPPALPSAAEPAGTDPAGTDPAGTDPAGAGSAGATSYSYWGYYRWDQQKSAWSYQPVGANDTKKLPKDGDIYGFRWALYVKLPRLPRAEPTFDELCADAPEAGSGEKRIGFVVDPGVPADAPQGETPPEPWGDCAVVDDSFTVQQALDTITAVRTDDSGLLCGIDGYPSTGCGETVKNAEEGPPDHPVDLALPGEGAEPSTTASPAAADSDDAAADDEGGGPPWGVIVAALVVVALAAGALTLRRRQV